MNQEGHCRIDQTTRPTVKFIFPSERSATRCEITRWTLDGDLSTLRWENMLNRLAIYSKGVKSGLFVAWFDGMDYCAVSSDEDIKEAVRFFQRSTPVDKCLRFFVSPDASRHSVYFPEETFGNVEKPPKDELTNQQGAKHMGYEDVSHNNSTYTAIMSLPSPIRNDAVAASNPTPAAAHPRETVINADILPSSWYENASFGAQNTGPSDETWQSNSPSNTLPRQPISAHSPGGASSGANTSRVMPMQKHVAKPTKTQIETAEKVRVKALREMGYTQPDKTLKRLVREKKGDMNLVIETLSKMR